ncbi:plasmid mobilization relaxosome protein MobC [Clostridium botulinum]|nr:plasmid mobilization relaxosome protein MobC [Clostridium botulinum]MBN3424483.1 plasmid mobilization relaxosome protein MobC [Clostridium botulinum]MBN3427841.1 plasmid mobilization relaxosome protein MobC [Clostridium botulinum]MBN3431282.1 plasmid mobilization relaxosome protein MobC [Clostridium botulinum]MBN3433432.1 plasmid mobilization relaxosome protein MobC [Clostridium botulinum]
MTAEIQKIGVNVNQIAKSVNVRVCQEFCVNIHKYYWVYRLQRSILPFLCYRRNFICYT